MVIGHSWAEFFTRFFAFLVNFFSMKGLIDEILNFHRPRFDAIIAVGNSSSSQVSWWYIPLLVLLTEFTKEKLPTIDNGRLPSDNHGNA